MTSTNAAALSVLLAHHAHITAANGSDVTVQKLKWIVQAFEVRPTARLPSNPLSDPVPFRKVEQELVSELQAAQQSHVIKRQHMDEVEEALVACVADSLPPATAQALQNKTLLQAAPSHLSPAVYMNGQTLQQLKENKTVDIFHMRDYRSAYGGLMNISRWLPRRWCSPSQRTRYTIGFEPYAILPWPMVPFDERFHGHGFSKSAWWFDRCADGSCDLRALPEVFVFSRLSDDSNQDGVLEHSMDRNRPENVQLFREKLQHQRKRGYTCQHFGLCSYVGPETDSPPNHAQQQPQKAVGNTVEQHFRMPNDGGGASRAMHPGPPTGTRMPPHAHPRPPHPPAEARIHRPASVTDRLEQLRRANEGE